MTEKDFSKELLSLIAKKKENNDKEYHTLIEEIDDICHCFVDKVLKRSWFINPILKEGKSIAEAIDKEKIWLCPQNKDNVLLALKKSKIIFTTTSDRKREILLTYCYDKQSKTYHVYVSESDATVTSSREEIIYGIKFNETEHVDCHSSILTFKANPSIEYLQGLLKVLIDNRDNIFSLIDLTDYDYESSLINIIKKHLN